MISAEYLRESGDAIVNDGSLLSHVTITTEISA
jgi:hypothetical protein